MQFDDDSELAQQLQEADDREFDDDSELAQQLQEADDREIAENLAYLGQLDDTSDIEGREEVEDSLDEDAIDEGSVQSRVKFAEQEQKATFERKQPQAATDDWDKEALLQFAVNDLSAVEQQELYDKLTAKRKLFANAPASVPGPPSQATRPPAQFVGKPKSCDSVGCTSWLNGEPLFPHFGRLLLAADALLRPCHLLEEEFRILN